MSDGIFVRASRGTRKAAAAMRRAAALARAADGAAAMPALFAVGMAHALPARWVSRVLHGLGVSRVRLRPTRLAGYELLVNPSDTGHTCVVEEFFVPPVCYDLSLVGFEPAAVIDCGAHIGLFTMLARRRFPSVAITAFEPNPENVAWLRENLRRNRVEGVAAIAAAVSANTGRAAFGYTRNQSESGRLGEPDPEISDRGIDVEVVDLPAFVRRLAPESLVLKMDIEGEEERLIPALLPALPSRCAIFFETHRGRDGWAAVFGALTAGGFAVRLLNARDAFIDGFALRLN